MTTVLKRLPLDQVYRLIEPGPVVLLGTMAGGRPNVMTSSWHMMVEFVPPLIACIVSEGDYSFAALRRTRECVIAIPGADIAKTVVGIGNCSGRDTDKFTKFALTSAPASKVAPLLLTDCIANLECIVSDMRLVNRYDLFILEVVAAWIDPTRKNTPTLHHRGYGTFAIDGEVIHQKSKMR